MSEEPTDPRIRLGIADDRAQTPEWFWRQKIEELEAAQTRWVKRAEREPIEAGEYPVVLFYPGTQIYGKSWADWTPGVLGGWSFRAHESGARVILWAENIPSLIL